MILLVSISIRFPIYDREKKNFDAFGFDQLVQSGSKCFFFSLYCWDILLTRRIYENLWRWQNVPTLLFLRYFSCQKLLQRKDQLWGFMLMYSRLIFMEQYQHSNDMCYFCTCVNYLLIIDQRLGQPCFS